MILLYLIFYHQINIEHIVEIMHSAFSRQFIFEIIPFIILFSVREMKFIDISTASEFFNSVIGRTLIGTFAFTFVTFSLHSINPKFNETIVDPSHSMKYNSFTPNVDIQKGVTEQMYVKPPQFIIASEVTPVQETPVQPTPVQVQEVIPIKEDINAYEKYITYATI